MAEETGRPYERDAINPYASPAVYEAPLPVPGSRPDRSMLAAIVLWPTAVCAVFVGFCGLLLCLSTLFGGRGIGNEAAWWSGLAAALLGLIVGLWLIRFTWRRFPTADSIRRRAS